MLIFDDEVDAIGQFTVNEWAHEVVYRRMSASTKAGLSASQETGITLGCGITAVSSPSSTLVFGETG